MSVNTMRELAVRSVDGEMVDTLTEDNNMLGTASIQMANKGIQNVAKKYSSITGAKVVDLDAPLEQVDAKGELQTTDVTYIAGEQFVPVDEANLLGGPASYFKEYTGAITKETGNNIEKSIIYNSIKPFAKANGKGINAGGTNDGAMYSMVCMRWEQGNNVLLYSENAPGSGLSFEITPKWNGGVGEKTINSKQVNVYAQIMKSHLGIQLINEDHVSYIANIDLADDGAGGYEALPSKRQIQEMIRTARATTSTSFIYCHPAVLDALADEYMSEVLRVNVNDEKYNYTFIEWNGVKFVTSWNFLETEATESFA